MEESAVTGIIETIVGSGVLGIFAWYLLRHLLTTQTRSIAEIKDTHSLDHRATTAALEANTLVMVGYGKALMAHDLTVTGINPSVGTNDTEAGDNAARKYTELTETFERVATAIENRRGV